MNRLFSAAPARLAITGVLALGLGGGTVATTGAPAQAAPVAASVQTAAKPGARSAGLTAAQGLMAVRVASTKRGTPYRWGATGPRAFDCSGYTSWTMKRVGKRIPRTADQQYRASIKISRASARPGDLVFYGGGRKYHVGIYAGNGRMWHAPHTGDVVKLSKIRRGAAFGRVR